MHYDTVLGEYMNRDVSINGVKKLLLHILTDMDVQPKFSENKHRN